MSNEYTSRFHQPLSSLYFSQDHQVWRETLRKFVDNEIEPYASEWDEAETFPRELYCKAADIGLLQLGYAEEYGGMPTADPFWAIVSSYELSRPGAGGIIASLNSHTIGLPPIAALGSEELRARIIPDVISGKKISALAITEPSGGSDVANLQTTATKEDGHYIVNGSKMFITSGIRADYYTVAVRTGGKGVGGISLLLIEKGTEGFTQTPLKKMGWWASDTAALYFDNCKVSTENLIGAENFGFMGIMLNFNSERLSLASSSLGFAQVCMDEAIAWALERKTFGKPLIKHQVIRHKIAQMHQRISASIAYMENVAWQVQQGGPLLLTYR